MSALPSPGDNARGILLMIGAIFAFSLMDLLAKAIGQRADVVMALWARYAGQALVVLLLVAPRLASVARTRHPGLQLLRSVVLLGATISFFTGLTHIGLAEATAIMDVNPVLVTLGGALFLGERLGPRRLAAIALALLGALVIIRPGSAVFSPYAVLPLLAAIFYSAYALLTRLAGRDEDPWTSLLYTALFGAVVLSFAVPFFWVPPDAVTLALMAAIGLVGAAGQLMLIRALALAEAGTVAPFSYAGLVFAAIWGLVFFGEIPDMPTVIGAAIIAGAGLYVWYRETRAARAVHVGPRPGP
ncbi:EamA domain-containing membrane protein RarD [Meinhardsimonia xiamenensis]|jgi:drug/metabolite transporter (DMT)-like permease|uniref:EamA domain-containing membrane protein RarD n=1 Tax=Meinhardsimonia xiamenensis TaxID=990712 RepID=A0A1G9H1S8_9RHOB|nr:DMT family transporter [Meinhardsimonia xiamenensis]PRX29753.1 EamA domain-containing membrane protein RarD [Meinhardsimonia xiamenensis]SDL06764.1 EamA domain-containing membrane protein RarD [Meinhardsimonia xiamenensis]